MMSIESEWSKNPKPGLCKGCTVKIKTDINEDGYCMPCFIEGVPAFDRQEFQIQLLTTTLNSLLESAKLCKECNVHLDSLTEAMDHAERVLAKTGGANDSQE